jgi:aspartyl/asparaginyl beta-hydroxylase (cupin superfamily)
LNHAPQLVAEADRAAAGRDFARAQALLREASAADPGNGAILLRLAGISRAVGQVDAALDAVHRALALAPLDFTALMMRASLLDAAGDPRMGEAWGHAIAQKPDGDLPPQLAAVLAEGELRHRAWVDQRAARLEAAMAEAESAADADERRRIARFRSNALRRTRVYHSEPTHFFFPELSEREYHPRGRFPWLAGLEAQTEVIAAEFEALLASDRGELVPYIQYPDHLPLRQWQLLNRNPDWTAIHLLKNGRRVDANADRCPRTMAAIEAIDQPVIAGASPNAMFSLLAPGVAIPPHVGISNARLVCHLPLIIPTGCWFRVGGETREWRRGEGFVFDDTIEHEAANPSSQLRVVLIVDLWHPDLTAIERAAVTALIGTEGGTPGGL